MTDIIIKGIRKSVKFCDGIEVEGYLLPNGEFRVGKSSASLALGFAHNYLSDLGKSSPKQLKALQDEGYTGSVKPVQVDLDRGATRSETMSLDDFVAFMFFASMKGKRSAIAIQKAITKTGLEDWFRLTFDIERQTLEEKRASFYTSYAKSIDWLQSDQEDADLINEQLYFLGEYEDEENDDY